MNPEQENFDSLRRLLALKRHEQPPPGYFENFSSEVIVQIRALQQRRPAEKLFSEVPWLARVWRVFEAQPMLAGACGVVICGGLLAAMVYSGQPDTVRTTAAALVPEPQPASEAAAVPGATPNLLLGASAEAANPSTGGGASLGNTSDSLFNQIGQPRVESVSFTVPGRN